MFLSIWEKEKNNMETKIKCLGTGSAFSQTMNQTSFLINDCILVDFGMTGPKSLKEAGVSYSQIQCVIPTHSHADHVGGLECLALYFRYVKNPRNSPAINSIIDNPIPILITQEYQRELWDKTLRGGLEYNEEIDGKKLSFSNYFQPITPTWKSSQPREVHEADVNWMSPNGWRTTHFELFRTKHVPDQKPNWESSYLSYGLFVDNSILITGDTRLDTDLIDMYGDKAQVIFHDCQFFPETVHAFIGDLRKYPKRITEKMYLIHYGDNYESQDVTQFAGLAQQTKNVLLNGEK